MKSIRSICFLPILLLFDHGAVAAANVEPYTRYVVIAHLDADKRALAGEQEVTFTNRTTRALNEIYFVLAANHSREKNPYFHDIANDQGFWQGWERAATEISFVRDSTGNALDFALEKAPALFQTYSLDDVVLRVPLRETLTPGASVTLKMGFTTFFPRVKFGDEGVWENIFTWRFGWNPVELAMENGEWLRTGFKMVPGHVALTLTVPANFEIAAGADIKKVMQQDGAQRTSYFETKTPQLSIPFTTGPGLRKVENNMGRIKIESWYRRDHRETAAILAQLAQEIIAYYEQRFGTYRYEHLVISEVSAPFSAMAADGMVLIMENIYRYRDTLVPGLLNRVMEYALAHEVAHLWWGVAMAPDFAKENWLSEAFANYLSYTFIEEKYGKDRNVFEYERRGISMALLSYIAGDRSFRQLSEGAYLDVYRMGWDEEISKAPADMEYANAIGPRTYEKGYWVLRALENEIGREKMFTVLLKTFQQYQGKNLSIREFQTVCEETTNKPLDWFFNQWVFGRDFVDYRIAGVESKKTGNTYDTNISVIKTGNAIANPRLVAQTERGESITHTLDPSQGSQKITFNTDSEVVKVQVDPAQLLPDVYRIDNTWPRQIKYRFGIYDSPLDAYSIRYYVLPSSLYLPAEGSTKLGVGVGVAGGYGPTHQWSVSSSYGVDKDKTYLSNTAAYNYRFSAQNSVTSLFNTTGYDANDVGQGVYTFEFGHQHTRYEAPTLGLVGRYLLPSNVLQNSLVFLDHGGWYLYKDYQQYRDEYEGTIALWRLLYKRDDSVRLAWQNAIQFDYAPPGINASPYYTAQLQSTKQLRLIPNWIVQLDARVRFASNETPTPEKFDFEQLQAGYGEHFRRSSAALLVGLDFPLKREMEASLLNIMVLKSIYGNVFTNMEALGGELTDDTSVQAAESGAQLKFIHATLGGVVDIHVNIGYVVPWYQQNTNRKASHGLFLGLEADMPI